MAMEQFRLTVSDEIGTVTAAYNKVENPRCVLTLAHGAGAGMDHIFMTSLAEALAAENIASLRFNFPFIENKKNVLTILLLRIKQLMLLSNMPGKLIHHFLFFFQENLLEEE